MLTFRKGAAGAPTAAQAMAEHLREQTMPEEMVGMADYYLRGVRRAEVEGTAAIPRQDMSHVVAATLGLDPTRAATHQEVVNLLRGKRADGDDIPGRQQHRAGAGRDRITYVDFTFSAPKSVSIAMALAPTQAERHMIVGAHRDAWMSAMEHLETIVAHARKGKGGLKGSVAGKLGWVSFDHYTARPTIEIPHTEADGTRTTLIQTVRNPKVAGDMQLHTHVTTPNLVACDDGSVGGMDMLALHDRVHEIGAYYQAHLATNLRAFGIDVVLDDKTETAKLTDVPDFVCEVFSKRTRDGEEAAREYVAAQGLVWDTMHPMELAGVLKGGARATRRQKETGQRGDDMTDLAAWRRQAQDAGYSHATVIRHRTEGHLPATAQDRLTRAYTAALPVLERQLSRRAAMYATVARTAAARGLIAAGVDCPADIDRITAAMREHGVRHDGQLVPLLWAESPAGEGSAGRQPRVKITTALHLEQEHEAMTLAADAAADRGGALSTAAIDQAVLTVTRRDGFDFSDEHGREQRRIIDALGTSGRFSVAVGVAGAGKTTLLRPLVEAWTNQARDVPRKVYGIALAWRQSDPLADAGIPAIDTMAIAAFLTRARSGLLQLDANAVVVVDELSQVGTAQALGLLRLRAEHGFKLVAIGDDRQGQAIEAGSSIALMRKALGTAAVPELASSVRQHTERDRDTALMFRAGRAGEAIDRLREDDQVLLVPGSRRYAAEAVADLWAERHRVNAERKAYTLTVSAPTNADARAISAAIRLRRRASGQLGADERTIHAIDQNGAEYNLPLASGDRVRLFARTNAVINGRASPIGHNGSVVEVERIEADGMQVRSATGSSGFLRWETLRDEASGRIRLTYGDVITIDAIQSATSTEHINALPSGSQAVEGFKAYVAQSRAREATWLVVADGPERAEIMGRRALGNVAPITPDDVWANVARNLSRQPEKELASDLVEQAERVYRGAVRSLATAFQPKEQRHADGEEPTTLHRGFAHRRDAKDVAKAAPAMKEAIERNAKTASRVVTQTALSVRHARRMMRSPAERPKRERRGDLMPWTEAQAEFADALQRAGLRPIGAPIMDGKKHRVPVEGDRKGRLSGTYIGHLDRSPAGYIHNFKTGEEVRWRASRPTQTMTPAEWARERARAEADRATREDERDHRERVTAHRARAIWNMARPAANHPYLARKQVQAHGIRQDRRGNLLVPMCDGDGTLWGVQTIAEDGTKMFMKGGRQQGTYATLGEGRPEDPLVITEGFATAATLREMTGFSVVIAFNSGNLLEVANQLRERHPDRRIIIAADNDHHLPRREQPLPNVGAEKAISAAATVSAIVIMPPFSQLEPGTDWNDHMAQHGREATCAIIRAELVAQGIKLAEPPMPRAPSQVDRDAARAGIAGPKSKKAERPTDRARTAQNPASRTKPRPSRTRSA